MNINFNFHGSTYKAGLAKQGDRLVVQINDGDLERQFGPSHPFYVRNHSVSFDLQNRSHSDLFAFNSSISKAISEQCKELL